MAGAPLFGLEDELNAGGGDGGPYALGLVSDDAVDLVGGNDCFGCRDDVKQERAATNLV